MKKNIFLTICVTGLLIISASHSFSYDDPLKIDGYKWKKFPLELKLGFVLGWANCAQASYYAAIGAMLFARSEFYQKFGARAENFIQFIEQYEIALRKNLSMKRKGINLPSTTVGQIIDMIDKIYEDARVKNWEITDVMPLVIGRLKGGWTEKDLDEVIAWEIKNRELSEKFNREGIKEEEFKKAVQKLFLEKPKALKEFD